MLATCFQGICCSTTNCHIISNLDQDQSFTKYSSHRDNAKVLGMLVVLPALQDFDVLFNSLISAPISLYSFYLFFLVVRTFIPALSLTLALLSPLLNVLVLRLYRTLILHWHFSVMLATGDHLLPLPLFSTLSPDEKSEFCFRHNFFRVISKRSAPHDSLISPDLVRIQRFVDYRESNQVNHSVFVWYCCWKSYVWQEKRVSCFT
jgi:hypothetical protein